jgi:hypothetical protein
MWRQRQEARLAFVITVSFGKGSVWLRPGSGYKEAIHEMILAKKSQEVPLVIFC